MFWRVLVLVALGVIDMALFGKMVWGPGGIVEYHELKKEYSGLQAHIAELDAKNRNLSRDIRLLQSDNQYVEKMVREKLRYLRDNEVVYIFPNETDAQNGAKAHDSKN